MASDPRIRASDADRDRTAALLREHHAGRLTAEEFNERLDKAYAAKTLGDLDQLLSDLPGIDLYELPDHSVERRGHDGLRPALAARAARQRRNIARLAGGLGLLGHGQPRRVPRLAAQRSPGQPVVPVGRRGVRHRPGRAVGFRRVTAAGPEQGPRPSPGPSPAWLGSGTGPGQHGITGPVLAFALSVDVA